MFDQSALAAAHQTLQLPAIARVTNLENGRQVVVRINDRGPATPHRLLEVTRRTATLLGISAERCVARVRVEVLADGEPGRGRCRAWRAEPANCRRAGRRGAAERSAAAWQRGADAAIAAAGRAAAAAACDCADRCACLRWSRRPRLIPGTLYVELSNSRTIQYANMQRARVAELGARIVSRHENGTLVYRVIIGPIDSVQQADSVLDQVLPRE